MVLPSIPAAALWAPIVQTSIQAGFPYPADDVAIARHDVHEPLIIHPQPTFLGVAGKSMP